MEENRKLYSQKAIGIATFFGGPLAAGFLIRKNCLSLDREKQAINSLIIGIVSTILLFWGIFQVPEHIMDKIPNAVVPLIYTAIVYLIVDKIQGRDLKEHEENKGEFFSNWKAAGIGLLSSIILMGGIIGYVYLEPSDWDVNSYDSGLAEFNTNEEEAMKLFDMLDYNSKQEVISFIDNTGLPKWRKNVDVITNMSKIPDIPIEFQNQNDLLLEYSKLRIEAYELIRKAVLYDSGEYESEINAKHNRIFEIIDEL